MADIRRERQGAVKVKRFSEDEGVTSDGFASFVVLEQRTGEGEYGAEQMTIVVAHVQHHHTKKAKQLANLFLKRMPRGDRFTMVLTRESPLSKSTAVKVAPTGAKTPSNLYAGGVDVETKPKKDGRCRIYTGGSSKMEIDMWAAVAISACDAFQEAALKRGWAARRPSNRD